MTRPQPPTRILVTTITPETNGYTGICLVCFEPHTVAIGDYLALGEWAREHTCNPERAVVVADLIGDRIARCLYCGSTDVYETRVLVDDRHQDMALQCGACHGVWAQ
ncbi:hypothetical protein [Actinomadura montaniterrae]|uniref:Uncharacterized protein n=1 Tax=Actinomadura montaniterrae TaxID=1803903 RepID=A0A6L3VT27_9ACTN|nr:hypothetical protein [Actinomadura montaniterrae]KAB2380664.1 hypothetical protein F9B16_17330 [Actinomadura montaniterrae]